jgi:predicted DNA-binding transcriptional regulator AlpA
MSTMDLVGTFEILRDYGVPRRSVYRYLEKGQFPQPVAELRAGGVWRRADVVRALRNLGFNVK